MAIEKTIFYKTHDKIRLSGTLTLPKIIKGFTLLAHGITMDRNEWDNFYLDISNRLYEKNIASLRFDFRGHGESEGNQEDITIIGELLDIEASINEINKFWIKKISIIGTSFGAGPTILYAYNNKERIKRIALLSPVLDYEKTFLKSITPWGKDNFNKKSYEYLNKKGYLLLDDEFKLGINLIREFQIIKPYKYLNKMKIPILIIHGNKDSMVPYKISEKYGYPNNKSKFITLNNADHGFLYYKDEIGNSKETLKNKEFVIDHLIEWILK